MGTWAATSQCALAGPTSGATINGLWRVTPLSGSFRSYVRTPPLGERPKRRVRVPVVILAASALVLAWLTLIAPIILWPPVASTAAPLTMRPHAVPAGLSEAIHRNLGPGAIGLAGAPVAPRIVTTGAGWHVVIPRQDLSSTISDSGNLQVKLPGSPRPGSFYPRTIGWDGAGLKPIRLTVGSSSLSGGRLLQEMGLLRTWYRVTSAGLEQGFSISRPPLGVGADLVISLGKASGWRVAPGGTSLIQNNLPAARALVYGRLAATDAAGTKMASLFKVVGGQAQVVVRVSSRDDWPITVDPTWSSMPTAALTNTAGVNGDTFGYIVAISADGTTAIVGAPGVNTAAGAAYIFRSSGTGSWSSSSAPIATLNDPANASFDEFGFWADISGDGTTAIVGAWGTNGYSGAAYVYHVPNADSWSSVTAPTAALTNPSGGQFGLSVGISADGSTAVVGANAAGLAFIFQVDGQGSWSNPSAPVATLSDGANPRCCFFGNSVSLSADGTTALIGSEGLNSGSEAAYIFHVDGARSWSDSSTPTATLTYAGGAPGDGFGAASDISADGTTAIVGAANVNSGAGAAYIYHVDRAGSWSDSSAPTAILTDPSGTANDQFGGDVNISGDGATALVTAFLVNSGAGAAYVYHVADEGSWSSSLPPTASFNDPNGSQNDNFGSWGDISADGNTAIISATGVGFVPGGFSPIVYSNPGVGAAYIFHANTPPTVSAGTSYPGIEGSAIAISGTASDSDGDTLTPSWSVSPNGCSLANPAALSTTVTCSDEGSYTLTLSVSDGVNPSVIAAAPLTVTNTALTVGPITAPVSPVGVNTPVAASAHFTDPGTADSHAATWSWGDGTTSTGTVTESIGSGSGSVSGGHTYSAPGVYSVSLSVGDGDSPSGSGTAMFQYVVVYNPTEGFVTGGGWINSPPGAYAPNPALTGKASFGFVSRYQNGATIPSGNTAFQLHDASFSFQSTDYQWLVISGSKAQFKGDGTVNGTTGYSFLLTACDVEVSGTCQGGTTDTFRIKIWNTSTGAVVYDNAPGADDLTSDTEALGGGNITIRKS